MQLSKSLSFFVSLSPYLAWTLSLSPSRTLPLPRQESFCAAQPSMVPCGSNFPDSFRCAQNYTCQSLGSGPTFLLAALCCEVGLNCTTVTPISCSIDLLNAVSCPGSVVHAICEQPVSLSTCGTNTCCPPNYDCAEDGKSCVRRNGLKTKSFLALASSSPLNPYPSPPPACSSDEKLGKLLLVSWTFSTLIVFWLGVAAMYHFRRYRNLLKEQQTGEKGEWVIGKPELEGDGLASRRVRSRRDRMRSGKSVVELSGGTPVIEAEGDHTYER